MSSLQPGSVDKVAYVDPTPLPDHVPKVAELGVTSAPLKSAAFFIGAYCKEYNGTFVIYCIPYGRELRDILEDFMLCKAEDRNPEHCLKEGRRVTRCATDLCVQSVAIQYHRC
jgi:NADH dehydrogenase (ubiquinone) 1 alpha subcomplex subunit 8